MQTCCRRSSHTTYKCGAAESTCVYRLVMGLQFELVMMDDMLASRSIAYGYGLVRARVRWVMSNCDMLVNLVLILECQGATVIWTAHWPLWARFLGSVDSLTLLEYMASGQYLFAIVR